jgi:hypothetical protein
LAKGGDAGEGGKQILSDILLLPMRCWEDPLFAFALYEPQAKTITVKLVTRTRNKGHAIAHGIVLQIAFDLSNPRAQSGMV